MKEEFILLEMDCTFSFNGTIKQAKETLNKPKMVFDVNEFVGTDDEFHSGSFTETISMNHEQTSKDLVIEYFSHNPDLQGECYSITTKEGKELINDMILNSNNINIKNR